MGSSHHENDRMRVLYEASYRGSVSTLNSLIQEDPLVLYKINSQIVFTETPLHISALLGHFDFTKALLTLKPQLALDMNSFRSTALHLASAEGHIDIVKELLRVRDEACLVSDQEGRIPLHYAVIRGRMEVVKELIRAKPESLKILDNGKTVLHLCVTYNHLDILKILVEMELHTSELLNLRDLNGRNTILHLAVMLKQVETTRYLLSIPQIRELASLKNDMGFNAHDIIERSPKDLRSLEIQLMLMNSIITHPQPPPSTSTNIVEQAARPLKEKNCWRKIIEWIGNRLPFSLERKDDNWLEEMRGNLSLVATVIASITFQAAFNPPGGVVQQGIFPSSSNTAPPPTSSSPDIAPTPDSLRCISLNKYSVCPGKAMSAFLSHPPYQRYLVYNTVCFVASLSVAFFLLAGFRLKDTAVVWMLSMLMCITLSFLAITYFAGIAIVTPDNFVTSTLNLVGFSVLFWMGWLGFITVFIALRFLIRVLKKCIGTIKHMAKRPRNENGSSLI